MLQFILGKSGTGKTEYIYSKVKELTFGGCTNVAVIVPDQCTFETEKAFLDILGAKASRNIKIFGFSGMCRYIFEQSGCVPKNVLDNGTRSVIMNLTLEQLSDKLEILNTKYLNSMSEIMLRTYADCKNNSITSDRLRVMSGKIKDKTLSNKLYETALIFDSFDAVVSQSYIDPLDDLFRAYNILLSNNIFKNHHIFVDSFSGFTSGQLKILRLLMNDCAQLSVALTLDPLTDGGEEVFATCNETYRLIKQLARNDSVKLKPPVKLTEAKRFNSEELRLLEQGAFRADYPANDSSVNDIFLYLADNIHSECEFVAGQIKKLVIENNLRYSDICVICNDFSMYNSIINTVFEKYEIPYYADSVKPANSKPVLRLVASIFRIITDNFERDDVMTLLKTGLTPNTSEEISIFENYVYIWNVDRSGFKTEFSQNPSGFKNELSEKDKKTLAVAEKVRQSIVIPIMRFKEEIRDKSGREITEMLYNLLTEIGVQTALSNMCKGFEENNKADICAEQIRIWNSLMEVFDKLVAVIGDMHLTAKRYFELLSIQTNSIELSSIPKTLDSVNITTAQRVRISKQKVSFLIGCAQGVFPATPHSSGVFSPVELKRLSENNLKLSDDFSALSQLETFMAYCCMVSAGEKLYISCPNTNSIDEKYTPSVIISETAKIFPNIIIHDKSDIDKRESAMYAARPAFEEYAKSLSFGNNPLFDDIFSDYGQFDSKSRAIIRALDKAPFRLENPENVKMLFGEKLRISASQIESFNRCHFAYFCNYGLRIRERRRAEINPMEYGTLVHYLFEKFFSTYTKPQYSKITDEKLAEFTNSTVNLYISEYFGGQETKSGSFLFKLKVLCEDVIILFRHIIQELSQSEFEVADCELSIGNDIPSYTLELDNGCRISVCGSVDRVDVMEFNGEKYLRIVDYKTGPKKFKLSDILYGLNLQMLIYLYSIQLNGRQRYGDILPAGILYMPSAVRIKLAKTQNDRIKAPSKVEDELKMNGLLLDNIEVIKGMDKTKDGKFIPVKIINDELQSKDSHISLEQFGKIFKKLELTVRQMGEELYKGKIDALPVKGEYDACEYCPYSAVCADRVSGERNVFPTDNQTVLEEIEQEIRGEAVK